MAVGAGCSDGTAGPDAATALDAALRAKLIVALLLGGSVQAPIGITANGTLVAFPLRTSDDQTGCAPAHGAADGRVRAV